MSCLGCWAEFQWQCTLWHHSGVRGVPSSVPLCSKFDSGYMGGRDKDGFGECSSDVWAVLSIRAQFCSVVCRSISSQTYKPPSNENLCSLTVQTELPSHQLQKPSMSIIYSAYSSSRLLVSDFTSIAMQSLRDVWVIEDTLGQCLVFKFTLSRGAKRVFHNNASLSPGGGVWGQTLFPSLSLLHSVRRSAAATGSCGRDSMNTPQSNKREAHVKDFNLIKALLVLLKLLSFICFLALPYSCSQSYTW